MTPPCHSFVRVYEQWTSLEGILLLQDDIVELPNTQWLGSNDSLTQNQATDSPVNVARDWPLCVAESCISQSSLYSQHREGEVYGQYRPATRDQPPGNIYVFVKVGQNHFNHEIRCTVSKQQDANQPLVIQGFILFFIKMLDKQRR